MTGAIAIVAAVVLLALVGVVLEHQAGAFAVVGMLLAGSLGLAAGFVIALALGLALWPGACVAVLCPSCYTSPAPDALLRAGMVYFTILGGLGGVVPGRAFRAGYGLGALGVVIPSIDAWVAGGAGLSILAGLGALSLASAIRWSAHRRLADGPDLPGAPPSTDFWDGTSWRAGPASGGGR